MADNLFVGDAEEQKAVDALLKSEMSIGETPIEPIISLEIDGQGDVKPLETVQDRNDTPPLESMNFGTEKRSGDEEILNGDSVLSTGDTNETSSDNQYSDLFVVDGEKWISPDSYLQCLLTGEEPYIDNDGIHYCINTDFDIALRSSVMASGREENENITNPDFREVIPEEAFDNSAASDFAQEQAAVKDNAVATTSEQLSAFSPESDRLLTRLDAYIEARTQEVKTKEAYLEQLASRLSQIYGLEQESRSLDLEIDSMISKFNKQLGDENAKKL